MDDIPIKPNSARTHRQSPWLIGSHSPASNFLYCFLAVVCTFTLFPPFTFAFGKGSFLYVITVFILFLVVLIFKNIIFKNVFIKNNNDSDAMLLEYLHQTAGNVNEEETATELLENALHLKEVRAVDCMAPRNEIVYVDVTDSVDTLQQLFVESRLSRIVVVKEHDLDQVTGYVHVQQLFRQPSDIESIIMPIHFVPENIPVSDLMYKLIRLRLGIAVVVDEYGSLAGLVTLEDALEELFGDIDDEYDDEEFIETQITENEYLFSGRLEISYLNEKYPNLNLPEGSYNTLSGYLIDVAHTIPEQGARLELENKTFVLELVSDRKVETVRVIVPGLE